MQTAIASESNKTLLPHHSCEQNLSSLMICTSKSIELEKANEDLQKLTKQGIVDEITKVIKYDKRCLKNIISRFECNPDDVEEIIQETALQALKSVDGYDNRSTIRSWVCGIARNVTCKHIEKRVKENQYIEYTIDNCTDNESEKKESHGNFYISHMANPETQWADYQMIMALNEILNKLPTDLREAFQHIIIDCNGYKYTSEKLNININTLKTRLHRAKKNLFRIICIVDG